MTFTHAHEVQNTEKLYEVANRYEYVMRMSERTDDLEDVACNISMIVDVLCLVAEVLDEESFMAKDKLQSSLSLVINTLDTLPKKLYRVIDQYLEYTKKGA